MKKIDPKIVEYAGEETKEFLREADNFDVEFPIPPQEKGMKPKHIKYLAVAAIVAVIILFSQTARAADTSDVLLGIVAGVVLGKSMDSDKEGQSANVLDLSLYNITGVAPDGSLVLTPIAGKKIKKENKPPPCARNRIRKQIPSVIPGRESIHFTIPGKCPNWSLPYGGLIEPE